MTIQLVELQRRTLLFYLLNSYHHADTIDSVVDNVSEWASIKTHLDFSMKCYTSK